MAGEHDFIQWLTTLSPPPIEKVPIPIGDDLAALSCKHDEVCLVGVDQIIDQVHFDSSMHLPGAIGAKAMNRNLSDCAAMAVVPAAAVVTIALPRGTGLTYAQALYQGIKQAGDLFNCPVIGGDTASHDGKLLITVTILARPARTPPLQRNGARVGDFIYVTGPLGGSMLGRHMSFEPRVAVALDLAGAHSISAMTDISDGLSRDLNNICHASGKVGAMLDATRIPIHDDAMVVAAAGTRNALEHALHDGEDYELLFTSAEPDIPFHRIGQIVQTPGIMIRLNDGSIHNVYQHGWEHSL